MKPQRDRQLPLTLWYYTTGVPVYFANATTGFPLQAPISVLDDQTVAQSETREVTPSVTEKRDAEHTQE
jgi:hypothetical protein